MGYMLARWDGFVCATRCSHAVAASTACISLTLFSSVKGKRNALVWNLHYAGSSCQMGTRSQSVRLSVRTLPPDWLAPQQAPSTSSPVTAACNSLPCLEAVSMQAASACVSRAIRMINIERRRSWFLGNIHLDLLSYPSLVPLGMLLLHAYIRLGNAWSFFLFLSLYIYIIEWFANGSSWWPPIENESESDDCECETACAIDVYTDRQTMSLSTPLPLKWSIENIIPRQLKHS